MYIPLNGTDYYAFGQPMPGRQFTLPGSTAYRFGHNGQERSPELYSGHYTARFWEYDSRIGRRWEQDPKPNSSISRYACFGNNPIWFSDIKGDSVELIIGKPYTDANGTEHPYGHAALRVFNAAEGYNMIYDFGRYGRVFPTVIDGEGIMNVYQDGKKYIESEMSERSSVGYSKATTVSDDKKVMAYFNTLTTKGHIYKSGAVPNGGGTAYQIDDYNIYYNNCLTQCTDGLSEIGLYWVAAEYDPREALSKMENKFKSEGLRRTEYNLGQHISVTDEMTTVEKKFEFNPKPPQQIPPRDNTRVNLPRTDIVKLKK